MVRWRKEGGPCPVSEKDEVKKPWHAGHGPPPGHFVSRFLSRPFGASLVTLVPRDRTGGDQGADFI